MEYSLNPISITAICFGLVTTILAFLVMKRNRGEVVNIFSSIMLLISIWTIGYGFQLASHNLEQILFWIKIEYIGIAFLPALWVFFILKYVGRDKYLTPLFISAMFIEPLITFCMVLTNSYHNLYHSDISLISSGNLSLISFKPGIYYYIHTIYFYLLIALGIILLLFRFRKAEKVFKKQTSIIFIAVIVPWVVNLFYILGYRPLQLIDLTPFTFVITAIIIAIGLLKFKLFDLIPIAREKIMEVMSDGILVLNAEDSIVDLNNKMHEIIGYPKEKIIGSNILEVFPRKHPVHQLKKIDEKILWEKKNSDSDLLTYELSCNYLFRKKQTHFSGKIIFFKNISDHIIAQKTLEKQREELESINKLKDKLFSIVAHDLRGPLASLSELLKMTDEGLLTEDEIKTILPLLSKNLGQTSVLLENLLSWSRSQLQGEKINPVIFDLRKLIQEKVRLFDKTAKSKGVTIVNRVNQSHWVYADQDMIRLVIRNLIGNAVKFTVKGNKIIISVYQEKEQCTVSIKDDGVGIDPKNMDKLFGLKTFTTKGTNEEQGTGLGLPLCRDFIEKNGGKIWVNSKLGVGSEFLFTLPCGEEMPDKDTSDIIMENLPAYYRLRDFSSKN